MLFKQFSMAIGGVLTAFIGVPEQALTGFR
jgi:hypothetical protein